MSKLKISVNHEIFIFDQAHCGNCPHMQLRKSGRTGCGLFRCTRDEPRVLKVDKTIGKFYRLLQCIGAQENMEMELAELGEL
jgi:hypothetical protein